jgi:hypothetical protein
MKHDDQASSRPRRILPLITAVALSTMAMLGDNAMADVAAPEPITLWQRNQAPDPAKVIIAGVSFSAAFAISGLLVLRRPGKRSLFAKFFIGLLSVALVCSVAATVFVSQKAKAEQQQWEEWDRQEENRRRNWRPPPKGPEPRFESGEPEPK